MTPAKLGKLKCDLARLTVARPRKREALCCTAPLGPRRRARHGAAHALDAHAPRAMAAAEDAGTTTGHVVACRAARCSPRHCACSVPTSTWQPTASKRRWPGAPTSTRTQDHRAGRSRPLSRRRSPPGFLPSATESTSESTSTLKPSDCARQRHVRLRGVPAAFMPLAARRRAARGRRHWMSAFRPAWRPAHSRRHAPPRWRTRAAARPCNGC